MINNQVCVYLLARSLRDPRGRTWNCFRFLASGVDRVPEVLWCSSGARVMQSCTHRAKGATTNPACGRQHTHTQA